MTLLATSILVLAVLSADEPAAPIASSAAGQGGAAAPAPAPGAIAPGNHFLGAAAVALERQPTISARVRQTTDLDERQLIGIGTYTQQASQPEVLSRLSLKTQVDRHTTSLLQVVDSRFLWERRDLPGRVTLTRIDLARVRKSIAADADATGKSFPAPLGWGGLPRMLRELDGHFDFAAPVAAQIGRTPVKRLEGRWNRGALAALVPAQKAAIAQGGPQLDKLPDHIPGAIVIFLGQADHFPHRVEYHRVEKDGAGEGPATQATMVLEFFDVQFGAQLDPLEFTYKPDNQEVRDETDTFLRRLGIQSPDQTARKGMGETK
jgi:hypothetical protein